VTAIEDLRFSIVVINAEGVIGPIKVNFPLPTLFGMPTETIAYGSTTPGEAANLSAHALSISINETVNQFAHTVIGDIQLRYNFMKILKYNFALMTNGGRVNFNATVPPNTPVTYYQTVLVGYSSNCD